LRRYRKQRAAVEATRMRFEILSRNIPDGPVLDRLLRYRTSLGREFGRVLAQLERLQRIRSGQTVPPPIDVNLS
jgi:hypothetical protein